jgi:transcriptional regulator with XRE-family HTH domain
MSQTELAGRTGMSQPSLGRKLRGATPWLASEILDITRALNQPIGWLYGVCAVRDSNPEPADYCAANRPDADEECLGVAA